MNWYKKSSIRDDKKSQAAEIIEELTTCIESIVVDHDRCAETLKIILKKLRGKTKGYRVLVRRSIIKEVIMLLEEAIKVAKDSPHEFSRILADAISFLVCEAE